MKVQKLNSRIIKYKICDDDYGVIYYTLDLDRYQLSISGETTASYKWVENILNYIIFGVQCVIGAITKI